MSPASALARVVRLAVYPDKGEPGVALPTVDVGPEGLAGDRRKKRPVHVVGAEHDDEETRANVFLDVPDADLASWLGRDVAVGGCVLHLAEIPKNCPGLYATVTAPGVIRPGDEVRAPASTL